MPSDDVSNPCCAGVLQLVGGDLKVRLGDGGPAVVVHRVVVACRSDFFASLLTSGSQMMEGGKEVVLKVSMSELFPPIINTLP